MHIAGIGWAYHFLFNQPLRMTQSFKRMKMSFELLAQYPMYDNKKRNTKPIIKEHIFAKATIPNKNNEPIWYFLEENFKHTYIIPNSINMVINSNTNNNHTS